MNCPRQTLNGATSASTNMATLLQKNCLKTLTVNNGVVVVNSSSNGGGNGSVITTVIPSSSNATSTIQTHMIVGQPLTAVAASTMTSRVLLPHELGSLPTTSIVNTLQPQHIHQTFQYSQQLQPQYILYNHTNDVTMLRPITTTTAVAATTTNTVYHHPHQQLNNQITASHLQQQHTFVAQNNIPKPLLGAIQYNNTSISTNASVISTAPILFTSTSTSSHYVGNDSVAGSILMTKSSTHASQTQSKVASTATVTTIPSFVNSAVDRIETVKSEISDANHQNDDIRYNGSAITDNNSNISPTIHHTNDIKYSTRNTELNAIDAGDSSTINATTTDATINTDDVHREAIDVNVNDADTEPEPEIDIVINNVVCSFSVRCHLNLREIALKGKNVEFRRENGMVTMKLRHPYTTASIWSSGRITCTGATSEDQAKVGARRYARCLQGLGFPVRFNNFRVVNVLGTCSMPWAIKIVNFSEKFKKDASYEPELHPGVTYKLKTPKATLKIFSTGSITVTAASVANVQAAIEHIFPLVYEFRKKRVQPAVVAIVEPRKCEIETLTEITNDDTNRNNIKMEKSKGVKRKYPFGLAANDPHEDNIFVSDDDDDVDEVDDDEDDDMDNNA